MQNTFMHVSGHFLLSKGGRLGSKGSDYGIPLWTGLYVYEITHCNTFVSNAMNASHHEVFAQQVKYDVLIVIKSFCTLLDMNKYVTE